ncbi:MAG: VanW family protein [Anaerolineales bacterium]
MTEQHGSLYVHPRAEAAIEPARNPWPLRLLLLSLAGAVLLLSMVVALVAGYQFMTQDQIYPGVSSIYGVDVAGMTRAEAVAALSAQESYAQQAQFTFTYADEQWVFSGEELGIQFDAEATIDAAYNAGRQGSPAQRLMDQFDMFRDGHAVSPVITYNRSQAQARLNELAENYINQGMVDATLIIEQRQISTTPSQVGRQMDVAAALSALEGEIMAMRTASTLELSVDVTEPALIDAADAAARAELALDERGVTFFVPAESGADAGPWIAQPESVENMLRVERVEREDGSAYYDVFVTLDQARDFLEGLSEELTRPATDARFEFNENTGELVVIEPSQNGRRLNVELTLQGFPQAVFSTEDRTVPLVFDEVVPTLNNNATAEELGITGLVSEATTYYYGSTAARRANIQVSAARFHGVVIGPNEEFSFNEWLGEVDQSEGFEEALIIVGDQTITGVGGGVCQVSTTAFQAAFYAGFPILERYAHGYRIGYYEQGEGVGLDAAIYSPVLDMRFLNDTPHHLLIETYVRPANSTITFRFYSTDLGRRVERSAPEIINEQPAPPPVYRANPDLQPGQVVQVDSAVSGAEVRIYRTVYQGDEVIIEREEFYSNYVPWPAQFEVAPGDSRLEG